MPAQAQGLCHDGLQAVDVAQAFSLCALYPPDNHAFLHSPYREGMAHFPSIVVLYQEMRFADAEVLYERSLRVWEASLGPRDPALATTLDNLGVVYASQEKFGLAEPLYRRSLALREKATVESRNNRATAQSSSR